MKKGPSGASRSRSIESGAKAKMILGRSRARIAHSIPRLPYIAWSLGRAAFAAKHPFRFVRHYITRTVPPDKVVEFRNGLKIHLSDSADDLITVFVILWRNDYGKIPAGATIVDIGANIGVFSLEAVRQGAQMVYAFEPNSESIALTRRNAAENGFAGRIRSYQLAVTEQSGATVRFPTRSDPSNKIGNNPGIEDYEWVETISLAEIITRFAIERIDLLKVDCEGAEYAIVLQSPDWVWNRVQEIRLEYHESRPEKLVSHLQSRGFRLDRMTRTTGEVGHLQLSRPESAQGTAVIQPTNETSLTNLARMSAHASQTTAPTPAPKAAVPEVNR